jgi:hypothetical protein
MSAGPEEARHFRLVLFRHLPILLHVTSLTVWRALHLQRWAASIIRLLSKLVPQPMNYLQRGQSSRPSRSGKKVSVCGFPPLEQLECKWGAARRPTSWQGQAWHYQEIILDEVLRLI